MLSLNGGQVEDVVPARDREDWEVGENLPTISNMVASICRHNEHYVGYFHAPGPNRYNIANGAVT
jgi:hypothetical protein